MCVCVLAGEGTGGLGTAAGRAAFFLKKGGAAGRDAEMVRDEEGAGRNTSILQNHGMKGLSLPACD